MFDALFPEERDTSLTQSLFRPPEPPSKPGTFQGFGGALLDALPHAALTSASAWAAIFDAYGKAAAYRDAPLVAAVEGRPAPDMNRLAGETLDQMGNSPVARAFREQARDFAPDPEAVGMAGQIAHGVTSTLSKAGVYAFTGPAAPALFGADLGINRAQELSDKGVDGGTAALAGVVTGAAGAVGMRLPAAMGATRVQSAAIGAVVNPALAVGEVGGIRALLEHADYGKIAAEYDPFDPITLAVATITGGAFGAAFHAGKPTGPRLSPEEHAAALTMHDVRTREADTLVRQDNLAVASAAHEAQAQARRQMDAGEAVSVAHGVEVDPGTLAATLRRVDDALVGIRDEIPATQPRGGAAQPARQADTPTRGPGISPADPETPTGIVDAVRDVVTRLFERQQPRQPESAPTAATPEQARAQEIASRLPDLMIPTGEVDADGMPVTQRVSELLSDAREIEANAKTETAAFKAAVNCALRFPQ